MDTNSNGKYDAGLDTVVEVVDYKEYHYNETNSVTVNLDSKYISSLKVKLVRDNRSPVQNYQGTEAVFNKEIYVN
ncbi:MAG TPA: hypothetical protein K8V56_00345 [Sporosarcina psychrophila]|uniref:Uncharacterized protein n=1 Tax=Sporosarcina psychrophila TaxID=1476 RepID=A0A921KB53_SPOPS|nr:hypothetical protein [Sporosarcina psychrophila]